VDGLVASSTAPLSDASHRPAMNIRSTAPPGYSTGISLWIAPRSIPCRLR
jgi:hypothetical protein